MVKEFAKKDHLILICGHYEGFDERILQFVDMELSIGDYVLTGGEYGAMIIIDSVIRLLPNVLGAEEGYEKESFYEDSLEYPQYTRPQEFMGMKVPDVLLSGNHAEIAKWRAAESHKRTAERRPDLLKKADEKD
jgi:tRNA (guanine37-N1)-methyltransferase